MNKYHCTKCNTEKIVQSKAKEINILCCAGTTVTLHKAGPAPQKAAVVVKPEVIPQGKIHQPTPPKVTQLDQPPGEIKLPPSQSGTPQKESEAVKPSAPAKLP